MVAMSSLLGCSSPRPSRPRWRSTGRRRSTPHHLGAGAQRRMAAARLSWLARNGRSRGPRACGVASPGEESLAAAIVARRSRLAVLWPDHTIKRPRGSRARQPLKEKTWQTSVRARGQAQRAKEQKPRRTERRCQPSGTKASARLLDTWVCRLRIAVPFDRSLARPALFTVRFDDRHPLSPNRICDEARPQLSLTARAAGNSDLPPATSLHPVSGGIETPGEPNSG